MIIFHEGMPRSGKSYAATKDHIIPALKRGRKVYARIDGIDYAKMADVAGIDEGRCRELLVELSEEQTREIWKLDIEKDSLVVIDELQNYWPQGRAALSPEMTKFIAEHGHHGWDIVNMGQLLKDCHRTWVNRTNRKIQFIKKDMLGQHNNYKWRMFTGSPDSKGAVVFKEVSKGDGTYDPAYFGCYKSHSEGTENTETYVDDRVVIWKNPIFRKWLPILGVAVLFSVGYIVHLFSGGGLASKPAPVKTEQYVDGKLVKVERHGDEEKKIEPKKVGSLPSDGDWPDVIADLSKDNRMRVAGVLRTAKRTVITIEWRDASMQVADSMEGEQIRNLGYSVHISDDGRSAILTSGAKRYIATAWPVPEPMAKVTDDQTDKIRKESRMMGVMAGQQSSEGEPQIMSYQLPPESSHSFGKIALK